MTEGSPTDDVVDVVAVEEVLEVDVGAADVVEVMPDLLESVEPAVVPGVSPPHPIAKVLRATSNARWATPAAGTQGA